MLATKIDLTFYFFNISNDISIAGAVAAISVNKYYLGVTPLTTDTTKFDHNTNLNDRIFNKSPKSTFINTQETLSGTTK